MAYAEMLQTFIKICNSFVQIVNLSKIAVINTYENMKLAANSESLLLTAGGH